MATNIREEATKDKATLTYRLLTYVPSERVWIIIISATFLTAFLFPNYFAQIIEPDREMLSSFSVTIIAVFTVLLAAFLGVYGVLVPILDERATTRKRRLSESVIPTIGAPIKLTPQIQPSKIPVGPSEEPTSSVLPAPTDRIIEALKRLRKPIVRITAFIILLSIIIVLFMNYLDYHQNLASFLVVLTIEYAIIDGLLFYRVIGDIANLTESISGGT